MTVEHHFYLIYSENKNPEIYLKNKTFLHIKAHREGKITAIISQKELLGENIIKKTKEEFQIILDDWIAAENLEPKKFIFIDGTEKEILQTRIDLNIYGVNNG